MSRRRLARALDATQMVRALLAWRRAVGSPWIAVLTYHRVATIDRAAQNALFDDGVLDATPRELDAQLGFLRRHFSIIGLDDLLAFRHGRALPNNPVLVTFDDGYRDNHDAALPILKRHGVRAVFFIATQYIDERRIFWWDRINYVVKRSPRRVIELEYPGVMRLELDGSEVARSRAILSILRIVKHSFGLDLDRFLTHLSDAAGVPLSAAEERAFADDLLMTWDQIRAMQREGMAIQSHTVTHRVVQTLTRERLDDELRTSKSTLEQRLGVPVRALAYPVGVTLRFAPHVRAAVEAAGYELAFTNGNGVNLRSAFDPLSIARLSPEFSLPDYHFRAMLALPHLCP